MLGKDSKIYVAGHRGLVGSRYGITSRAGGIRIRWDSSKPDGTLRKLTDVSRLHSLGWHHKVGIDEGIHRLYEWYLQGICINHREV